MADGLFGAAEAAFSPDPHSVGRQSPDASDAPRTKTVQAADKKSVAPRAKGRERHRSAQRVSHGPKKAGLGMNLGTVGKRRMHHPLRKRGR